MGVGRANMNILTALGGGGEEGEGVTRDVETKTGGEEEGTMEEPSAVSLNSSASGKYVMQYCVMSRVIIM